MTNRTRRLIQLNAKTSKLIELRYGYDDDTNQKIAIGAGAATAGGLGGLYLRNRGDDVLAKEHASLLAKGADKLAAGAEGPVVPASLKDYSGGNLNAIKTGAKDVFASLKAKLGKLRIGRNFPAPVALSTKERVIKLNSKVSIELAEKKRNELLSDIATVGAGAGATHVAHKIYKAGSDIDRGLLGGKSGVAGKMFTGSVYYADRGIGKAQDAYQSAKSQIKRITKAVRK